MPHILVVDDDRLMLTLVAAMLPEYRVTLAHDGVEALAVAAGAPVDLIITDYLMPSMTGDELIGRLREHQPAVKALVMTGHGLVLDREGPGWWHTEPHIAKPFRADALRQTVAQLLAA